MKRDMDLIRSILLWATEQPHGFLGENPTIEGHTDEEVAYHVHLMGQAGLVKAAEHTALGSKSPEGLLMEVTWQGHDFIGAAKNDALWRKAGGTILKEGSAITFGLLKQWLEDQAKAQLGLG